MVRVFTFEGIVDTVDLKCTMFVTGFYSLCFYLSQFFKTSSVFSGLIDYFSCMLSEHMNHMP